ncbi:MAG: NAD(P)H-dependent glycerol-3-phosphate dehydrogenase [Clostridia bacterium]|nr:NAD(P)H-dependent glycerol-3-phosphate dehydrogenase [Clostridia bacterium]
MKITVVGPGRWGSCITWYLNRTGHEVTLYGRKTSSAMQSYLQTGKGKYIEMPNSVKLSTDLSSLENAEVIIISIPSQSLRDFLRELKPYSLKNKIFVLCMKGIEVTDGKRLSQIAEEETGDANKVAVWLGPGHVQEFYNGIPNCMVIDSNDVSITEKLVNEFSSDLIRFYYGNDLIGNEVGAAAKNVIGIAAGILDGMNLTTLKGALMSRGTREIARLIAAMGGNELSAYGLCHLGDYEATVFSPFSHNRQFGEAFVKGEKFESLAEGYYTVKALVMLGDKYGVDLPICKAVHAVLYENESAEKAIGGLFSRSLKQEF